MDFGESLVRIRQGKGITRKAFAEQLEIPYTTLRNYETGQREPGHKILIKMATILHVSVDELIDYEPQNKKAQLYSSEAMKLAADYDSLDEWGKRQLRSVADNEMERCTSSQKRLPKLDIDAEVASYKAELERQEEVEAKLSASDGFKDTGMEKMA